MRYQHIIWDWNGTLIDDVWLCVDVLNTLLSRRNMAAVTIDYYRATFGFPVKNFYEGLGFDFSTVSYESLAAEYITEYNHRRFECALAPYALETIERLSAAGMKHSILSAYQQDMLEDALRFYGICDLFSNRVGMTDYYAHSKAQMGLSLLSKLDLKPSSVILIGDTLHDFEVASDLNIDCVLVDRGHQHSSRLTQAAPKVVNCISQLAACL